MQMPDESIAAPTDKDYAEFLRLMFERRRVGIEKVIAWADAIIDTSTESPEWAIELSLGRRLHDYDVIVMLGKVPGVQTNDLPRKLVCAVIREDWQTGRLTDEQFVKEWYSLYPEYPEDGDIASHAQHIWQYLDNVIMCLVDGETVNVTIDEARFQLRNLLEPYGEYLPLARRFAPSPRP